MADNTSLNAGTGGDVIATDDIAGVKYQRVKVVIGADGVNGGDVASGNPLPISGTVTANAGTGTMNVSVQNASIPVTDNAGSLTVDNNGTFAVQASQTGTWNVGLNAGSNAIGSITNTSFAVTQGTAANLNATVVGTGTFAVQADTELPAAAALADGAANPTTPTVGAACLIFNGTTWDRLESASIFDTGANNNFTGALAVKNVPYKTSVSLAAASGSISTFNVNGCSNVTLAISGTTTGTFIIEGTGDLANWGFVECFDIFADQWVSGQSLTPTNGKVYGILSGGLRQVRVRNTSTLGSPQTLYWNADNSQEFIAGIDTGAAPHNFGYTIFHKEGNYATTQTSVTLHATTSGKRFAITDITVSTDGTTAGVVTIYEAATAGTAFSAGTTPAIFRSAFAPSATVKPGAIKQFPVPYLSAATSNIVLVTITGITSSYIQINGYEI